MFKKTIAALVAAFQLLTTASAFAFPTSYNWEWKGYAGAGAFMSLYADPSIANKIYVNSDVAGIMVSTDAAASWDWMTEGMTNVSGSCMIKAPSDNNIMYRACGRDTAGGCVGSSTDGGANWNNHLNGSQYSVTIQGHKAIAVNRTDANTAYVSFTNGSNAGDIWRTTNRTTWTEWKDAATLGIGGGTALVVDMSNTYLWMGSGTGLRRITLADGTVQTHTLSHAGNNDTRNRDIVAKTINGTNYIFVVSGDSVAYTTNHGSSWTYLGPISGITSSYEIARLDVFPGATLSATKIIVGTRATSGSDINSGNRYKSSDGGGTWSSANGNLDYAEIDDPTRETATGFGYTLSIIFDPHDATGNTVYASDYWGIWKSTDLGANWVEKVTGAGNSVITDLDVAPDGTVVITAMDNGVLKFKDGDAGWTQLIPNANGGQAYPQVSGHCWQSVLLGNQAAWLAGNGIIVATNSPWSGLINKILRSTNGGNTWTLIPAANAIPSGKTLAETFPDNATFGGMWGNGYMRAMAVDPSDENHIIMSLDGTYGTTAASCTANATTDTFTASNSFVLHDRVMIGGSVVPGGTSSTTRYYVINPTSTTWQISTTKGGSAVDLTSTGTSVTYQRRRDGGIFESTDGGLKWLRLRGPAEQGSGDTAQYPNHNVYNGIAINPTDPLNFVVARWSGSGFGYTTNGGSTWSTAGTGNQGYCYDLEFSSTGVLYAACDNGGPSVYRSTNKGATWTRIKKFSPPSGPADGIAIDPDDPDSLVVSTSGYAGRAPELLYHTHTASTDTEANNNFVDITGNIPDGLGFGQCAFNNVDGYLYCGRYAGSVWRMNLQTEVPTIGTLTATNVQPASMTQNSVGNVVISATLENPWPADGSIEVGFGTTAGPFTFNSGGTTTASFTVGGSGGVTVTSTANDTLILTRTGGSEIAADASFQITATQIKVPANTDSTGVYSIKTKDSVGNVIDQDLAVAADTVLSSVTTTFRLVINCEGQNCWITTS